MRGFYGEPAFYPVGAGCLGFGLLAFDAMKASLLLVYPAAGLHDLDGSHPAYSITAAGDDPVQLSCMVFCSEIGQTSQAWRNWTVPETGNGCCPGWLRR